MNDEIQLDTKLVGDIEGDFYIPSYQRGYRWGKAEIVRLLNDIESTKGKTYCLQPIVVRKANGRYELIDGQQRLTTIYLIRHYINKESRGDIPAPKFTITYETRKKSGDFLNRIDEYLNDESRKEENIDFWFFCSAYENIKEWFSHSDKKSTLITNINKYFDENVKIIWYEVGASEDSIGLFTRLNIGKIPLTNAELVKALFLSRDNDEFTKKRQEEISFQWDNMEKELHNQSLWYFLTNKTEADYQTRIDLVLDLVAKKPVKSKERYYTFFKFDEICQEKAKGKEKENILDDIWLEVHKKFLMLKDWHADHERYHKIGYLIASSSCILQNLSDCSQDVPKDKFIEKLDEYIKKSIEFDKDYAELSYETQADQKKISRLLLLFNVESVRQHGAQSQWFPFDKHKFGRDGKVAWSLEHIHAQQSENLRTKEMWKEWIRLHLESVKSLDLESVKSLDCDHDDLIHHMNKAVENSELSGEEFNGIQQEVVKLLSVGKSTDYLHRIANLALLSTSDNTALSNSTFDVKRNEIIKMDKAGQYIPFCTRMIFMKYYTPSEENQIHFWGYADRNAYLRGINSVLEKYLKAPIALESEER